MAKKERTCFCCMRKYVYCHSCKEDKDKPTWYYLVHSETCKHIYDIWQAYRGGEINKLQAREQLGKFKDELQYIMTTNSIIIPELKEIFIDFNTPKKDNKNEESKTEDMVSEEKKEVIEGEENTPKQNGEHKKVNKKIEKRSVVENKNNK